MVIYLKKIDSYIKITRLADDHFNLGIIEHNGCLDIKPALREMLSAEGENVVVHPAWHATRNGACCNGRGTGFAGYVIFPSCDAGIEYLGQYFELNII